MPRSRTWIEFETPVLIKALLDMIPYHERYNSSVLECLTCRLIISTLKERAKESATLRS